VRAGVLRVLLSLLVAIALVAGMTRPCAACTDTAAPHAELAMAGMDDCHSKPPKAPGHADKAFVCLHCLAFGSGALVPVPGGLQPKRSIAVSLFAGPVAHLAGLLTSPDTGPPRSLRT
jgi:hypothetical protein